MFDSGYWKSSTVTGVLAYHFACSACVRVFCACLLVCFVYRLLTYLLLFVYFLYLNAVFVFFCFPVFRSGLVFGRCMKKRMA